MKQLRKITLIGLLIFFSLNGYAQKNTGSQSKKNQDTPVNEISFWATGGISALNYDVKIGDKKTPLGAGFGIGYTRFTNDKFGFGIGLEMANYRGNVTIEKLADAYNTLDVDGRNIEFRTTLSNYEEKQQLMTLNIPLTGIFQTNISKKNKFYSSLGLKLGIPVRGTYNTENAVLKTSGYYPEWNQVLDKQQDMGYGSFNLNNKKKDLDFKVAYMLTAEAGFKWPLSYNFWLYTGIYGDYALNNILKNNQKEHFVSYNPQNPEELQVNSILISQYTQGTTQNFVDKVSLYSVGLKLKLGFELGKKAPVKQKPAYTYTKHYRERTVLPDTIVLKVSQPLIDENQIKAIVRDEIASYLSEAKKRRESYDRMPGISSYNLGATLLSIEQKNELDDYVNLLRDNPDYQIKITGHTCDLDSKEKNQIIGQERADRAKDYLVGCGIRPSRIQTFSAGMSEPLVPNTSEKNRKINRRLEVKVIRTNR